MSSNNRHLSIPGYLDKGVRLDEPDGGTLPATSSSSTSSPKIAGPGSGALPQQLPSMSDMLVCYPTLTGYYAWRNRARGSWYIEAIVQVFMRYAKCEDVCAMLNRCEDVCAMLNRVRCALLETCFVDCSLCVSISLSICVSVYLFVFLTRYVKCKDVCAMLNRTPWRGIGGADCPCLEALVFVLNEDIRCWIHVASRHRGEELVEQIVRVWKLWSSFLTRIFGAGYM
ncbi:hypothetical protein RRG08_058994 [Elysia crispata]|uniref:Caspase family p10 domain-containing protein n=1 Tax=Elysia crispata TaxID=231223 RepID=A0AAE0YSY4_9GAST|nr:hypothetical protein RRG08_058994 [Elysia crispata]